MANVERIEKLLAMILVHDMKDAPQEDKAVGLHRAGFSNAEIATVLGTTSAVVSQQLYKKRQSGKPRKKAGARKKSAGKARR